jgi:hypothetical protein
MKSSIKRSSLLAGLAMLSVTFSAARDVYAGSAALNSISLSGGLVQGSGGGSGDPPYIYVFDVYLTSGEIIPGSTTYSNFTVDGLVGVDTNSLASATQPDLLHPYNNEFWQTSAISTSNTTSTTPGFTYESNLTWSYTGGPTVTTVGFFLGQFTIETDYQNYVAGTPPVPFGSTLNYTYSLDGGGTGNTGSGTIIVQNGYPTPEPSSLILMLAGATVLPWLAVRKRVAAQKSQAV